MKIISAKDYAKPKTEYIGADLEITKIVSDILYNVAKRGDEAVIEYTKKFDCEYFDSLEVSKEEIEKAYSECDEYFIQTLEKA